MARKFVYSAVTMGMVLLFSAPLTSSAAPVPGLPSGDWPGVSTFTTGGLSQAEIVAESRLNDAGNEVWDAAHKGTTSDYAGLEVSAATNSYILRWKGEVPREVNKVVAAHRKQGIKVTVVSARYNRDELKEQSYRLMKSGVRVQGARVQAAGGSNDGNALDITLDSSDLQKPAKTLSASAAAEIPADLTGGMPVRFKESGAATPQVAGTRYSDANPYSGGAMIRNPAVGGCTTGFSAMYDDKFFLVTAAHCTKSRGENILTGDGKRVVGTVADQHNDLDTAFIWVSGQSIQEVYSGGLNDKSSRFTTGIKQAFVGQNGVCFSGAFSSVENCFASVSNEKEWVNYNDGMGLRWVQQYWGKDNRLLSGNGDSGGPIYSLDANGRAKLHGLISGSRNATPCPDIFGNPRTCSYRSLGTDITDVAARYSGMKFQW
ncbi:chymotrypsin family serine protease [Streptomyces laurentii]|uniref:hypothetical protein n=1 Tax=Streptomyces laurentii TaxID=39478 RepID=UPI00367BCCAD